MLDSKEREERDEATWTSDGVHLSAETTALLAACDDSGACGLHKKIAWRIKDLEHEILVLKSRHNAATQTCRMPQETLAEIFLTLAYDVQDAEEWIGITYVCRHWRSVALDCAALWTNLPFISPAFTNAILPRTKNAPISLCLTSNEDKVDEYIPMVHEVVSRIDRVRSVVLRLDRRYPALEEAFSKCTGSAEALKELCITFPRHHAGNGMSLANLKLLGTPALVEVELEQSGVRWCDIPFGPELVALTVTTDSDQHRPTLSQFRTTLAGSPLLNVATICGYLPRSEQPIALHSTLPSGQAMILPELTQLYLVDSAANISQFLRTTRLPQVHEMQLAFNESIRDPAIVGHVLSSLRTSWIGDDWTPMGHKVEDLYVAGLDHLWRRLGQKYYFTIGCPTPDGVNSTLTLMVCFQDHSLRPMDLLPEFSKALDLTSVSSLSLYRFGQWEGSSDWLAFSQLTKIQQISVEGKHSCLAEFIRTLNKDPALSNSTPSPIPLFPSLRELSLKRLPFSDGYLVSTFASVLHRRAQVQHHIPELKFVNVKGITNRHYQELRQMAPDTKICEEAF